MIKVISKKVETRVSRKAYDWLSRCGGDLGIGKSTMARLALHAVFIKNLFPHMTTDELFTALGDRINEAKKDLAIINPEIALSINVSEAFRDRIDQKADEYNLSKSEFIRLSVEKAMNQEDFVKSILPHLRYLDASGIVYNIPKTEEDKATEKAVEKYLSGQAEA